MRYLLATIVFGLAVTGCTAPSGSTEQQLGGMGCSINAPDPRACDPADTKKTTVCHVPPGNPSNAHTICVGNSAVPAHLDHGDFLGTCSCTSGGVDAGVGDGSGTGSGNGGGGGGGGSGSGSGVVVLL
ncbi:MAG: hypothetical protein JO257_14600 [Deltaproteobacteria bacterium]|nr:hypothetical protein [Deltaproteobacteria bacterium]